MSNHGHTVVGGGDKQCGKPSQKRPAEEASIAQEAASGNGGNGSSTAKRTKKKHTDPAILQFRGSVQQCCKRDDLATAMSSYDRAIADNTRIEAQSFYSLLNLCDGLGDTRGIHIGTPLLVRREERECRKNDKAGTLKQNTTASVAVVDDVIRRNFAERVKKRMDTLDLPLTETAFTALVRLYCRLGDVEQAECVIQQAESKQQCKVKLRLYAPLLTCYCEAGRLVEAMSVWQRVSSHGLTLTEVEYCALIRCCTNTGDAAVVARVISDLSEDVMVPSHETTLSIAAWFQSPYAVIRAEINEEKTESRLKVIELLAQIQVPHKQTVADTMEPVQCDGVEGWTVTTRCNVDVTTGKFVTGCLQGETLKATSLSSDAWHEMKDMNEAIAITGKLSPDDKVGFQGGGKGRRIAVDAAATAERKAHWDAFVGFLATRSTNRPVDVVIDGANVGYFEKNFAGAPPHVDYKQIDWVVQHFLRKNLSVLLVMHSRHFARHFMPREVDPVVQRWLNGESGGVLFRTPPGMNDDWFWLHAALHFGPGTLVVTNDEMRDHHFQMVAPRAFLRWRDRHQIHFTFGGWQKDTAGQSLGREVLLKYPDPYSRRIQRVLDGFVIPLPKRGDTHRFLDGAFVAETEPIEETYICIRPTANCLQSS